MKSAADLEVCRTVLAQLEDKVRRAFVLAVRKQNGGRLSADEEAELDRLKPDIRRAIIYGKPLGELAETRLCGATQAQLASAVDLLLLSFSASDLRRIIQMVEKRLGPRRRPRRTTDRVGWNSELGREVRQQIRTLREIMGWSEPDSCAYWQKHFGNDPPRRYFGEMDAASLRKAVFDR